MGMMNMGFGGTGEQGPRAIDDVRAGMHVLDVGGADIGTIRDVFVGDPQAEEVEAPEELSTGVMAGPGAVVNGVFPDGLGSNLPQVERTRLLHEGYVRINLKGWFSGERFASSEVIHDVTDGVVHLSVDQEHLIR
jgi:hypothetical protein